MTKIKMGFAPVYDNQSKVLILGSFPSVKSREISFYYGNKQNRFWKMLCGYFQADVPLMVDEKRAFLLKNNVALWDMVTECEIVGSSDASIKNAKVANLQEIINKADIRLILLNGTLAYQLFTAHYNHLSVPYIKMPSTSPANPRYDEAIWWRALDDVFKPC